MRQGKYPFIVGFLAAPVLLYVVFVISPYIQAFYISLTDWKGISAAPRFIGLENFTGSSTTRSSGPRCVTTVFCYLSCRWSRS